MSSTLPKNAFQTSLDLSLRAKQYDYDVDTGEEDRVCHDILKACSELEKKEYRDNKANFTQVNKKLQSVLHRTLMSFATDQDATWKEVQEEMHQSIAVMMQFAKRILDESYLLEIPPSNDLMSIGSSRLVVDRAWLVHVWQSPECAHCFYQATMRIWSALFDYHFVGIRCPISGMFCIRGQYVSVTIVPPLAISKMPPQTLPGSGVKSGCLLSYTAKQLLAAIGLSLQECAGVPLYPAEDGHFYVINLEEVMGSRLSNFPGNLIRTELIQRRTFEQKQHLSYEEYLSKFVIPEAVETFVGELQQKTTEERKPSQLTACGYIRSGLHRFGINICLLYQVFNFIDEKIQSATGSAVDILKCLAGACKYEMTGRTLKTFVRLDLQFQTSAGKLENSDVLDVMNRVAKLATTVSNKDFWEEHFLPALRKKFRAPKTFSMDHQEAGSIAALRIASARIGCEFDATTVRFHKLAPIAGAWALYLPSASPKQVTTNEKVAMVEKVWRECYQFPCEDSLEFHVLRVRAFVYSVLHFPLGVENIEKEWEAVCAACKNSSSSGGPSDEEFEFLRLVPLYFEVVAARGSSFVQKKSLASGKSGAGGKKEVTPLTEEKVFSTLNEITSVMEGISKEFSSSFSYDHGAVSFKYVHFINTLITCHLPAKMYLMGAALQELSFVTKTIAKLQHCDTQLEAIQNLELEFSNFMKKEKPNDDDEFDTQANIFFQQVSAPLNEELRKGSSSNNNQLVELAIKMNHRCIGALIGLPLGEKYVPLREFALRTEEEQFTLLGMEDPRTSLGVYYVALLACVALCEEEKGGKSSDNNDDGGSHGHLVVGVRKLIQQRFASANDESQQMLVVKAWTSHALLRDVHQAIQLHLSSSSSSFLIAADEVVSKHLHHFGKTYLSTLISQKIGRGWFERLHMQLLQSHREQGFGPEKGVSDPRQRERLTRFYNKWNPNRIPFVDSILIAFDGRIDALFKLLVSKYGPEPDDPDAGKNSKEKLTRVKRMLTTREAQLLEAFSASDVESLDQILYDIFHVCDVNDDGFVTMEECFDVLKMMKVMQESELKSILSLDSLTVMGSKKKLNFEMWKNGLLVTTSTNEQKSMDSSKKKASK